MKVVLYRISAVFSGNPVFSALHSFRKCTALLTLSCFLFSFIFAPSLMAMNELPADTAGMKTALADTMIPAAYGRITDMRNYHSKQAVLIIQDLHCHAEVQKNISRILKSLDDKYGLQGIYVEGGYGKIDTSWLCDISDRKLREKLVESLVEQGRLTGGELYSVKAQRPDVLRGLDDEALHKANIRRLAALMAKKGRYQEKIKELSSDLGVMKLRYFSVKNREFDKLVEKYRSGRISGERYYAHLFRLAGKINADPDRFNAIFRIELADYPDMALYLATADAAGKIRYKKVSRELQAFLQELKAKLPYAAYNALLTKTDNFSNTAELFDSLSTITKAGSIRYESSYPELAAFLSYVEKSRRINPVKLIDEERKLTKEIRAGLSANAGEREVAFLSDLFGYFQDYLLDNLSADDYACFKDKFATFRELWGKYAFRDRLSGMEEDFRSLAEYYDVNCRRNEVFIKNLDLQAEPSAGGMPVEDLSALHGGTQLKVVVTGGFHADGLRKYLDDRRITCITVTPNVTKDTGRSAQLYEELMKHQAVFGRQALAPVMESIEMAGGHVVVEQGKVNVVFHEADNAQLIETIATVRNDRVEINDEALKELVSGERITAQEREKILNGIKTAELMAFHVAKAAADMVHPASAPEQVMRTLIKTLVALPDAGNSYGFIWEIANDTRMQKLIEEAAGLPTEELSRKSDLAQELIQVLVPQMAAAVSGRETRQQFKDRFMDALFTAFVEVQGRETVTAAADPEAAGNGQTGGRDGLRSSQGTSPYEVQRDTVSDLMLIAEILIETRDGLTEYFGGDEVMPALKDFYDTTNYATQSGARNYDARLQLDEKELEVVERLPWVARLFHDLIIENKALIIDLLKSGGKKSGGSDRPDYGVPELRKYFADRDNREAFISFLGKLTAGMAVLAKEAEQESLQARKREMEADRFFDTVTFDDSSGLLYRPKNKLKEVSSLTVSNEMNFYETDPDKEAQREAVDVFLGYGSNNVWDYAMRRRAKTMIIAEISEEALKTQEYLYKPLLLISEDPAQFLSMLAGVPLKEGIKDAPQAFEFINKNRLGMPKEQRLEYAAEVRARVLNAMSRQLPGPDRMKAAVYADYVYHYMVKAIDTETDPDGDAVIYDHFAFRYQIPAMDLLEYRITEFLIYQRESESRDPFNSPDELPDVEGAARKYMANMQKKDFSVLSSQESFNWLKNIFATGNVKYILTDINAPEEAYAAVSRYLGPERNVNGLFFTNIVDVELGSSLQYAIQALKSGVYPLDVMNGQKEYLERVSKHIRDARQYLPGPAGRSLTAYSVRLERDKDGGSRNYRLMHNDYQYLEKFSFFYETIDVGENEPVEEAALNNRSYNPTLAEMVDKVQPDDEEFPMSAILGKNLPLVHRLAQLGFGNGMIAAAIAVLEYSRSMFHPRGFIRDHGKNNAGARAVVYSSYLAGAASAFIFAAAALLSMGFAAPLMHLAVLGASPAVAGFLAASVVNLVGHTYIDWIYLKDEGVVDAIRRFSGADSRISMDGDGHIRLTVARRDAPGEQEAGKAGKRIRALLLSLFLRPVLPGVTVIDGESLRKMLLSAGVGIAELEDAAERIGHTGLSELLRSSSELLPGVRLHKIDQYTIEGLKHMASISYETNGRLSEYTGGPKVLQALREFHRTIVYARWNGVKGVDIEAQLSDKEIEVLEQLPRLLKLFSDFSGDYKDLISALLYSKVTGIDSVIGNDQRLLEIRGFLGDRDNREAFISIADKLSAGFDILIQVSRREAMDVKEREEAADRFFKTLSFDGSAGLLYRPEYPLDEGYSDAFRVSNEINLYEFDPDKDADREAVDVFLGYGSNNVWDYAMRRHAKTMIIADVSEDVLMTQEYLYKPLLLISDNPAQFLSALAGVPLEEDIKGAQRAFDLINGYRFSMPKQQRLKYAAEIRARVLETMSRLPGTADKMKAEVYADYVYHYLVTTIDSEAAKIRKQYLYGAFAYRYQIPTQDLLEYKITEYLVYRQQANPDNPFSASAEKQDVFGTALRYIENMKKKNFSVLSSQESFDWLKNIFATGNVKYILTDINDPEEAYTAVKKYLGPARNVNGLFFSNIVDVELTNTLPFMEKDIWSGIYAFDVPRDQGYYLRRTGKYISDARQYLPGPANRSLTAYSTRLEIDEHGDERKLRIPSDQYSYLEGISFFYETIDVGDNEPVEEAVVNNRSYNTNMAEMVESTQPDEDLSRAAILRKNLPKINWLAQLGFGSGMIASAIAVLEYPRSMFHPRGFIGDHGKNDAGARAVVYSSYLAGAASALIVAAAGLLSMGFAAPLLHLAVLGAASAAAGFLAASAVNLGAHTYIDWVFLKDEGIADAIRRFGGVNGKIDFGEDGHIKMIVARLNDPDGWELMNTGLKDRNGQPVWASVKLKDEKGIIVVHRAAGQDAGEIKDMISGAIEGNSAKLARRLGLPAAMKLVTGITVDYDDAAAAVKTTADGRKLYTRGYLAQITGAVNGFVSALGLLDDEERKNREAALKSVFMDIDVSDSEEFLKNIDPIIRRMKNSQIVIPEQLVNGKFSRINELARSKGVEIYVKVTDSANMQKYEDLKFAGIGVEKGDALEITNFSRRDSYAAKIITGYADAPQLQEKLRGVDQAVVLRVSEIHKLMTGRDTLEISAIVNLLGEYISDIAFRAYTRVEIYRAENFSGDDLPDEEDVDALIRLLNGENVKVSNRAVLLHLSNIGPERQKVFIREIVSRALMNKALNGGRLNSGEQETLLREVLWQQKTGHWTAPLPALGTVLGIDLQNSKTNMAAVYAAINSRIRGYEKSGTYRTSEAAAGELLVLLLNAERKINRVEAHKEFDENTVRRILAAA